MVRRAIRKISLASGADLVAYRARLSGNARSKSDQYAKLDCSIRSDRETLHLAPADSVRADPAGSGVSRVGIGTRNAPKTAPNGSDVMQCFVKIGMRR